MGSDCTYPPSPEATWAAPNYEFEITGLTWVVERSAGYDMAIRRKLNLLHSLAFAAVFSLTSYVIIDLEYPRQGLIQMSESDQVLFDQRRRQENKRTVRTSSDPVRPIRTSSRLSLKANGGPGTRSERGSAYSTSRNSNSALASPDVHTSVISGCSPVFDLPTFAGGDGLPEQAKPSCASANLNMCKFLRERRARSLIPALPRPAPGKANFPLFWERCNCRNAAAFLRQGLACTRTFV